VCTALVPLMNEFETCVRPRRARASALLQVRCTCQLFARTETIQLQCQVGGGEGLRCEPRGAASVFCNHHACCAVFRCIFTCHKTSPATSFPNVFPFRTELQIIIIHAPPASSWPPLKIQFSRLCARQRPRSSRIPSLDFQCLPCTRGPGAAASDAGVCSAQLSLGYFPPSPLIRNH